MKKEMIESENDIIISGISGRFPNSRNISEFSENLFGKVDMVDDKETRWKHVYEELPSRFGKISDVEKFDTSFFSILSMHARFIDPQLRMLLEHAYEAILDAGISPQSLHGSRTGVFVACCTMDSKYSYISQATSGPDGTILAGNATFLLSNRLSYILGLCGTSLTLDTACSSSAHALDCAFHYIDSGVCDGAIVAGSQLDLFPHEFFEFNAFEILSKDGMSRPFDIDANGFVRAEAVCAIFLQKRKDSKRIYAQLVHSLTNNDGFKKEGPTLPSIELQQKLMETVYVDIGLDPNEVKYVEAHATGTKMGDPQEVTSIDRVFCKTRSEKLIIGSVKSNMGHAEAASGLASVAKILMAFENGKFPPNINLTKLRDDVPAFSEGRIEVAVDAVEMTSPYIAMNSFGIGGANAHMLFKRHSKEKLAQNVAKGEERMIFWSGRTEDAVNVVFDDIASRPMDIEYIGLLQNSQLLTPDANSHRGFAIFKNADENATCIARNVQRFDGIRRPVVFVFAGMGTQWFRMGLDLMQIPLFAKSIEKSHDFLLTKDVSLKDILFSTNENIYDNFLYSSIGIVSIELALSDVLFDIGIKPDYIIGHSVGEIACSYADGCITREQALTIAYLRARVTLDSGIDGGAMAAVGMHYSELEKILPHDIDIACQNSKELTTISGPNKAVLEFVKELKSKHCFAKAVACAGVPFHSRYIAEAAKKFEERLEKVLTDPKERSAKWYTASFPDDCDDSKYCNARYHAANYTNAVYFEQAAKKLPSNGLMIEISPHGFLHSLLKSAQKSSAYVALTNKTLNDGKAHFMSGLGKIFQAGLDFDVSKLYPAVEFPVSRGTPMISPLIKWNHGADHFVPYNDSKSTHSRIKRYYNFKSKDLQYVNDHVIDGKAIVPAAFWIFIAWKNFSLMHGMQYENTKVTFKELECLHAVYIPMNGEIILDLTADVSTGQFSLSQDGTLVARGKILHDEKLKLNSFQNKNYDEKIVLTSKDFYKHARVLGYQYMEKFQKIFEITDDGLQGKIQWNKNWVVFIDCVLQTIILAGNFDKLELPFKVSRLSIDPISHKEIVNKSTEKCPNNSNSQESENADVISYDVLLNFETEPETRVTRCGGFEFQNPYTISPIRKRERNIWLQSFKFIPFLGSNDLFDIDDALQMVCNTSCTSLLKFNYSVIEVNNHDENFVTKHLEQLNQCTPFSIETKILSSKKAQDIKSPIISDRDLSTFSCIDMIIFKRLFQNRYLIEQAKQALIPKGVLVTIEDSNPEMYNKDLELLSMYNLIDGHIVLTFRFKQEDEPTNAISIEISEKIESWLDPLKEILKKLSEENNEAAEGQTVILYSYNTESSSGLLGLYNCLRLEYSHLKTICVLIDDKSAPKFDVSNQFYRAQLTKGFVVNVIKNGHWGCYQHLNIKEEKNPKPQTGHCFANYSTRGDLSTLKWRRGNIKNVDPETCSEDLIKIQYAALNFQDVVLAYGYIPDGVNFESDCNIGLEFTGVRVKTGERVAGAYKTGGGFATFCDGSDPRVTLFNLNDHWTMEETSTMIVAYLTVYYAFFKSTTIERGKSILIHSGAGAVGQAAIHTAFNYQLEVFTTVGTQEKREFLLKTFPKLKPENIGNSRDTSFYDMVMRGTHGRGVDYVLNSLFEDKMIVSLNCLAKHGYMLEIGQADIYKGTKIDLKHLEKFVTIKWIKMTKLSDDPDLQNIIQTVAKDIQMGVAKPINRTIFDANDIVKAFQYMSTGNHIGKVLLKIREDENDKASLPLNVFPRFYCDPAQSYIVVGGLGGIGLEFSQWLVSRKCRKLVLSSSRGITNQYQAFKIKYWKQYNVEVIVSKSSVTTVTGCKRLVEEATTLGPVAGIFNLAVVLHDAEFENQTVESFEKSLAPKAVATQNLHEVSAKHCPSLEHFVVYSSISCSRGTPGQTNYGMSNSVMERIIEKRHAMNLPAKAIQLGPIGDVGSLADAEFKYKKMLNFEVPMQSIASLLEHHDCLLLHPEPIVGCTITLNKKGVSASKEGFIDMLMKVLNIEDRKSISMNSTFSQLGIDSLAGVELNQMIEREYGVAITASEIRTLTISELEAKVNAHMKSVEKPETAEEDDDYDAYEMYKD